MSQYLMLCRIDVEHAFWRATPVALNCVATAPTQDWLRRRDVLARDTPNGVALWCEASRLSPILDGVRPGDEVLAWKWYARDPLFSRYTSPAAKGRGWVPLLSSSDIAEMDAPSAPPQCWMHTAPEVSASQLQPIEAPALARHLDSRDVLRPPVLVVEIDVADVARNLQQGVKRLAGATAQSSDAGVAAETANGGMHYRVRFGARASFWKYLFLLDLQVDAARLTVIDLDGRVRFDAAPPVQFPGGRQALVFVSDREIVMQQQPSQRFQLREQGERGERVLIRRLPNADPGQVVQDEVGGVATLISEIYIN